MTTKVVQYSCYISFPRVIHTFFSFLLIYGGLGFGVGVLDWGFQLMGFGACGVGPSVFFGVGALYINIEE